jgi:hypothetical protein
MWFELFKTIWKRVVNAKQITLAFSKRASDITTTFNSFIKEIFY